MIGADLPASSWRVMAREAAEAANLSTAFPDVDINGTTWAIEHRERNGARSWMENWLSARNPSRL